MNVGSHMTEKILYTNKQGHSIVEKLHMATGGWHMLVKDVLGHYDHSHSRLQSMLAEAHRNGVHIHEKAERVEKHQMYAPNPWQHQTQGHVPNPLGHQAPKTSHGFVNPINKILGR